LINGFKSERFVATDSTVVQPTLFDLDDTRTDMSVPDYHYSLITFK